MTSVMPVFVEECFDGVVATNLELQRLAETIKQMPMTALCQGLSLDWPVEVTQNDGPN